MSFMFFSLLIIWIFSATKACGAFFATIAVTVTALFFSISGIFSGSFTNGANDFSVSVTFSAS